MKRFFCLIISILTYFMMTDEKREAENCEINDFVISSNYSHDHPHPDYTADDETFSPLWDYYYEELLPDESKLRCWHYTEGWEKVYFEFDYSGF